MSLGPDELKIDIANSLLTSDLRICDIGIYINTFSMSRFKLIAHMWESKADFCDYINMMIGNSTDTAYNVRGNSDTLEFSLGWKRKELSDDDISTSIVTNAIQYAVIEGKI